MAVSIKYSATYREYRPVFESSNNDYGGWGSQQSYTNYYNYSMRVDVANTIWKLISEVQNLGVHTATVQMLIKA